MDNLVDLVRFDTSFQDNYSSGIRVDLPSIQDFYSAGTLAGLGIDSKFENRFKSDSQVLKSIILIRFNWIQFDKDMGWCY